MGLGKSVTSDRLPGCESVPSPRVAREARWSNAVDLLSSFTTANFTTLPEYNLNAELSQELECDIELE